MTRTLSKAALAVLLPVLAGCASQREVNRDVEVSAATHDAGSAIDSDYLVRRGAILQVDYASGCRFYVESGGILRGLDRGVRQCTAYVEGGARVARRDGLHVVPIKSARKRYADRNTAVIQELGPGIASGGIVSVGGFFDFFHDDDDDDDDGRRRSSRVRDVKISDSSYEKKSD